MTARLATPTDRLATPTDRLALVFIDTQVEGTCSGRYGFIVMVTRMEDPGMGEVTDDGTARAKFHIKYDCIVFRPFKGEVVDAVVTQVNKFGFFAEAGPLQLFVSNALITDDMQFDSSGENCYVSEDQQIRIQRDASVRVRIVGMRIDANDIFCIGTIKDDYLGLIDFGSGGL